MSERYIDWRTHGHEPETFAALSLVVLAGEKVKRVVKVLAAAPGGFREVPLLPAKVAA